MTSDLATPPVKNTHHINLVTAYPQMDEEFVVGLLEWLRNRCVAPPPQVDVERHRKELRRRSQGGRSLAEVAMATGEPLKWLQTVPTLLRHYGFARYDLGGLVVSVDILDAAGDLGMPQPLEQFTLEVFGVASDRGAMGRRLAQLARDIVDSLDVRFAFGGYAAYVAQYAGAQHKRQPALDREWRPQGFLWPLTFFRDRSEPEERLGRLPVYAAEQRSRGVLVQTFEDLWNGNEDDYRRAARELGLASVWDLDVPAKAGR